MEDQSDLCIWQKKEGRIRRYFLLFYLGFNALSTYNHIYLNYNSDVFTNCFHYIYFIFNIEISLAIPRPIFVANVLAGDLHSYSNNRPKTEYISIVSTTWIFNTYNQIIGTYFYLSNGHMSLIMGMFYSLLIPHVMSLAFGSKMWHILFLHLSHFIVIYICQNSLSAEIKEKGFKLTFEEYEVLISNIAVIFALFSLLQLTQHYLSHQREELLKELNRKKELESEAKERFFACMSHEMRNPLHALISTLDLISNTDKDDLDPKIIKSGKFSGELLLTLIGNILDFSKLESNKMECHLSSIDLREKVANILMFETRAKTANLYLSAIFDPKLPAALETDGQKISQVLINLIGNALKFTSQGGITVNIEWMKLHNVQCELNQDMIKNDLNNAFLLSSREHFFDQIDEEVDGLALKTNCNDLKNRNIMGNKHPRKTLHFTGRRLSRRSINSLSIRVDSSILSSRTGKMQGKFEEMERQFGICKIEIIDSGIGLTSTQSNKLFQPFMQADASTSQNYGGTGLGLWISRSQIRLLGGDIKIESEVGMGCNFMIGLPMESSKEIPAIEINEDSLWTQSKKFYKGKSCLYIDDQASNQLVLAPLLKYLGFKCISTSSGLTALQFLESNGPQACSLIITDLRMPKMSGQAFIMEVQKLVRRKKARKIPVIVLTGEASDNEKNICTNVLGVDQYLNKPASFNHLTEAIHRVLDRQIPDVIEAVNVMNKAILIIDDDQFCSFVTKQFLSNMNIVIFQAYTLQTGLKKYEELGMSIGCVILCVRQYYQINLSDNTGIRLDYVHLYDNQLKSNVQDRAKFKHLNQGQQISQIIMDNSLPDGSGRLGAEQIRAFEKSRDLPQVSIISAIGDSIKNQMKCFAKEHKIADYLQKPFTKEALLSILLKLRLLC